MSTLNNPQSAEAAVDTENSTRAEIVVNLKTLGVVVLTGGVIGGLADTLVHTDMVSDTFGAQVLQDPNSNCNVTPLTAPCQGLRNEAASLSSHDSVGFGDFARGGEGLLVGGGLAAAGLALACIASGVAARVKSARAARLS